MTNAEHTLYGRLAEIIGFDEPFAKEASSDAQLDEIVDELFTEEHAEDTGSEVENQVEEPVAEVTEKTAADMEIRDIMQDANFRQGFADTYARRRFEIEDAVEKVAGALQEKVAKSDGPFRG